MKRVMVAFVLFSLIIALPSFAEVLVRLHLVSNENGVIVVDVQAMSDAGDVNLNLFQGGFRISETLEKRVVSVEFESLGFSSEAYEKHVGYSSDYRKFSWVYTYLNNAEPYTTITDQWTSGLRVTITYNIADEKASLTWAGQPILKVIGADGVEVPSDYIDVPPELQDVPLPVTLDTFNAVAENGNSIRIVWMTQSELDNLGFHVYRSTQKESDYGRITSEMIRGQGTTSSAHEYNFVDHNVEASATYWYVIESISIAGLSTFHGPVQATLASALKSEMGTPEMFTLHQNYPNPFNPVTEIRFDLAKASDVTISIYNVRGSLINQLVNDRAESGSHTISWDGTDARGNAVQSGVYIYELKVNDLVSYRKMTLMK